MTVNKKQKYILVVSADDIEYFDPNENSAIRSQKQFTNATAKLPNYEVYPLSEFVMAFNDDFISDQGFIALMEGYYE